MDGIRFLYRRRARLALRFVACVSVGVIGFLAVYLNSPTSVQGTLALSFRGMERHEYPSGRKFTVEGFRTPDVLKKALDDAGIAPDRIDLRQATAGIFVTPIVPPDVQARWAKQEKDGFRKDEFFPSEFRINIQIAGLHTTQEIRLFDALVKSYQDRVKSEHPLALSFVSGDGGTLYERLTETYDFWDIPALFAETSQTLERELRSVIVEALQYPDPRYHLGFRSIARDLTRWHAIRLGALEALTYQGPLVKNRDLTLQRVHHRLLETDALIKQKTNEASEGLRLLALIDRTRPTVATGGGAERGVPLLDVNALDRLLKSDYVGPVVAKISKLQSEAQELEVERGRLQRQLTLLPKAVNVDFGQLPAAHKALVRTLSAELDGIVHKYNGLLDEYLTVAVTSLVAIKQSPIVIREVYPPRTLVLIMGVIVFLSVCLAIVVMGVEHLFDQARGQARTAPDLSPTASR